MLLEVLRNSFAAGVGSLCESKDITEQETISLLGEITLTDAESMYSIMHQESGLVAVFNSVEVNELADADSRAQQRLYLCASALVGAYILNGRNYLPEETEE